ncbi:MAG: zinc dependent phospholipase C family protein [Lachnospiraceae bacterium]|nr:zinc dependent phospholipase C family protein [Lachnospiraceae bacterium]
MPTTYTHYKFGTEVLKALPPSLQVRVKRYRELYDIGQHGPDILFYYKALFKNPVAAQGSALHRQNADVFFSRAVEILRAEGKRGADTAGAAESGEVSGSNLSDAGKRSETDTDAARAYLYGFICHFVLDSECHPYVQKMMQAGGISHNEIEMELDRYLLVEDGFDPVRHVQTAHVHPSEENAAVIAPFFQDLSVKQVYKALRSMIFYHNLFRVPGKVERALLFGAMKLVGIYNSLHGIVMSRTPNPACRDYCLILKRQYDEAVPVAVSLIEEFERVLKEGGTFSERFHRDFEAGDSWESLSLGQQAI